jgi:hypothetical protein
MALMCNCIAFFSFKGIAFTPTTWVMHLLFGAIEYFFVDDEHLLSGVVERTAIGGQCPAPQPNVSIWLCTHTNARAQSAA